MAGSRTIRSLQGDSVDAVCWRIYGRTESVVEMALQANPGLADLGALLPENTPVICPPVEDAAPGPDTTLKLWD